MKYIKKFETLQSADGYVIPNPFIGNVEDGQLIANTEDNKKLEIEGGSIVIADVGPTLISFTIMGDSFAAELGMDWEGWLQSEYGNVEAQGLVIIDNNGILVHVGNGSPICNAGGSMQYQDDVIINGEEYDVEWDLAPGPHPN